MSEEHISDHDLERYYLGMVTQEEELAPMEEHLLWCHSCVDRAEETQDYVDIIRRAIILGNYDLDGGTRARSGPQGADPSVAGDEPVS